MSKVKISWKTMLTGACIAIALVVMTMSVGWNEAGKRQVVQYANGSLSCVYEPGPYAIWFGSNTEYPDVITFDFDNATDGESGTLDQLGIGVRYRDGGLGTVYGMARFGLPDDCVSMINLHKDLRGNSGLAHKLIKPYTEEIANQSAGLMTSEESYAEKRGVFTDWFRTQLVNGRFKTRMEQIITTEIGMEYCLEDELLTDEQEVECKSVKKTRERVPVIDNRTPEIHLISDLDKYGITLSGFQLQAPDYEPKTLNQISDKRDATMGVITANANAERAKAEAAEAEQKGIKDVVEAKYAAEKIAAKEIVDAEKRVKLAAQSKLEAKEKALAAEHFKAEQILKGEGESARKRLVMEADGALQQKLDAYVKVNYKYADALGKHKLVPDVQMGSDGEAGGSTPANDLMSMLMVKTAKDLQLDLKVK